MPIDIAVSALMSSGRFTNHSERTRCRWVYPPQNRSPTVQPVEITASPTAKSGESLATTVPVRSMPGTIG